ncbi:hypothetical protein ACH4MG_11675 [Streptomyces sp. NPDC017454]|uniref:hypothetical protein n=1 Tax=Streptomyces sp. NPDC017454 TaxID=3364997 RepID=UPI003795D7C8
MDQRRGSTSQPLEGAGFDPAFIPGLSSPVSGEPADVRPAKPETEAKTDTEAGDVRDAEEAVVGEPSAEESAEPATEPDEEEAPAGPVFEASDRRAKIVADHKGVRLALDDQSCEFRWDEVGAVETETGRFGKRFTVTVHTPDRRWYPIEIEATSRSRFPEWESALDDVLDAYFEDGETEADAKGETKPDAESESEAESEVKDDAESEAKDDTKDDAESEAKDDTKADMGGKD